MSDKKFYVYKVFLEDEIIYIGKGQGNRSSHVLSGKSHNAKLNEYYYKHTLLGEPSPVVKKDAYFEEECSALKYESYLIRDLLPECNIQGKRAVKPSNKPNIDNNKVNNIKTTYHKKKKKNITSKRQTLVVAGDILVDVPDNYEDFIGYMTNLYEDLKIYDKTSNTLRTWLKGKKQSKVWAPYLGFIEEYIEEVGDLRITNGGLNKDTFANKFNLNKKESAKYRNYKSYIRRTKKREPTDEECMVKINKLLKARE